MKNDLYQKVTDSIIAALEQDLRPWHRPWSAGHLAGPVSRPLRHSGKPYSGINVVMLWAAAMERGYAAPLWMTYRQAAELGGQVRKGEKGNLVVYANAIVRTEANAEGQDEERRIPFLKGYSVFNVEQIDGLPAHYTAMAPAQINEDQRDAKAEAFFAATGATVRHGGNRACYTPALDVVDMPDFTAFRSGGAYYATLAHELTHWTRHGTRLDRDFGRKNWGDQGYAMEELVAELGAAFLCADLQLEPQIRDDHAPYVAGWLKVLKDDRRAIFAAASFAQKAADFLHGLQPGAAGMTEEEEEAAA